MNNAGFKSALLFIITLYFFITGCSNNSSPVGPSQTTIQMLTQYSWQVQKVLEINSNTAQSIDVTNLFPYQFLIFNTNGTYSSSVNNGSWQLINLGTTILFNGGSGNIMTAQILQLNPAALNIKMAIPSLDTNSIFEIFFVPLKSTNNSPVANFDTLWSEFNLRYSFFELKNINWDSLYNLYSPRITASTSNQALFNIMSSLLSVLKDGHVNLYTPYGNYSYTGWFAGHPVDFLGLDVIKTYLSSDFGTTAGGYMYYGKISTDIGYIYIGPDLIGDDNTWSEAIDKIIDILKDTKGIIVDIRNNGGGSDNLGIDVASRFADQQRTFAYFRFRIMGLNHSAFTAYTPFTIAPAGINQYTNPVALLTNRHCFSSAEETILMFKSFPNVISIGDTTGGGSGNPIILQLPNGWSYWVSQWIEFTADKKTFEGIGLAPDIPVQISAADSLASRDAVLERAILELNK
ncbi:MAG: S41 family peptidase [Ignavibacteriaceae bacterium]